MATQSRQTTDTVFMVRPYNFTFNIHTAEDNHFQTPDPALIEKSHELALAEFDAFVTLLRDNGVKVVVAEDTASPATPDSLFPNNWFSTHEDGTMMLYPMYTDNRNKESYKNALFQTLKTAFDPVKVTDLRPYREKGLMLEGTGCLILDRVNKIVYACRSERISEPLLDIFCQEMGYKSVVFDALDRQGLPIYHTNVMMALAEKFAVICLECIRDEKEREKVVESLKSTGHEIVDITLDQVYKYAGNMLSVRTHDTGYPLMVMSRQAYDSLTQDQIRQIESHARILAPSLLTIETLGGGSARCMMGEIYEHK
ncbi:citrulline utilization hydrolase CtlX [Porphyromonas sp.]|uniref:citrulline utilization hydrolase CtlX n=1 Tax=Porphyromonas sp. TaxID=1924944 RepID=UPI0026DB4477|nr:arginine deiminase-related protein [Porphyromonas sp.]MDO4770298.1 arginine deiminase-related protein [Porphyromonas sp.]